MIYKISMYMIKYLEKKPYFVVENAVELTKKLGKAGASGFVNAFLRKFTGAEIPLPKDETERLSVKYSYPIFAVKYLIKDYGKERAEQILSSVFPDNTLCFYGLNGKDYLNERGVAFSDTTFDNVFTVKNFTRNEDYDKGLYTYQALGSVAICEEVDPCETLFDCCAAPGGKSVRLSYKCGNVLSADIHPHRVELVKDYAFRMGRTNITTIVCDSTEYRKEYEKSFSAVLCDAPCSGFGVVNDDPDIKLNRTESDIYTLCDLQLKILENVCNYVKVGGYLYYSTCSLFKRENIDIVNAFLSKHDNFEIIPVNSPLPHTDICGTNQFLPDISGGNGFYLAKLKRLS